MKQYLHKSAIVLFFLVALNIPKKGIGQCLCDAGVIPDSVVQVLNFDSITQANTNIIFNRFDPNIGTLQCFRLAAQITTVIGFDLQNNEGFPDTYLFESFRRSRFSGPGGFVMQNTSPIEEYGPYDLAASDPVGTDDEVSMGPDTIFNGLYRESYGTGSGSYLGAGTVTFDYLNTSTTTLLDGSSNYELEVYGYTRMNVRLVYYWCPSILLSTNIKSFSAVKDNNRVNLSWLVENEEANNNYELQMSRNGRQFHAIGKLKAGQSPEASASYQYEYLPDQAVNGKMYFRVKQVDGAGKATYSAVRFIDASQQPKPNKVTTYPNPVAKGKVSMQFGKLLNGNYKVELISLTGQVVYQQFHRMNNTNSIYFDIPGTPAGIYYLRASNTQGNETFTTKLTVQH
jgi:hypothetical protein